MDDVCEKLKIYAVQDHMKLPVLSYLVICTFQHMCYDSADWPSSRLCAKDWSYVGDNFSLAVEPLSVALQPFCLREKLKGVDV